MTGQAPGRHACPAGHPVRATARFCPTCGTGIVHPVHDPTVPLAPWQPTGPAWPTADVAWPPEPVPEPAPAASRRPSGMSVTVVVVLLLMLGVGGGIVGVYVSRRADPAPVRTAGDSTASPGATPSAGPSASPRAPAPATPPPSASGPAETMIGIVDVRAVRADGRTPGVGRTLNEYFSGINDRDTPRVLAVMDPAGVVDPGNPRQVEQFRANTSTTTDTDVVVHWIRDGAGPGGTQVGVTFTSRQEARYGPDGQTCSTWSLVYTLSTAADGRFLIVRSTGTSGPC